MIGTNIAAAQHLLRQGKLVAIPTETVYGLAANALDPRAVASIFEAKNRPSFDPLIVHVKNAGDFSLYADVSEKVASMAEILCPGPITFILPKKEIIPAIVTSGLPEVGLRVPQHPLASELLNNLDFPLAAPSANPFGFVSPTTAAHVAEQLGNKISYILDGGPCKVGVESTIIRVANGKIEVLRLGGLSLEELEDAAGEKVHKIKTSSSKPAAPGMLTAHYSPGVPVIVSDVFLEEWEGQRLYPEKCAALRLEHYLDGIPHENQILLSSSGDLTMAAARLFGALRDLGQQKYQAIFAQKFKEEGLGRAINDRLKRAAAKA